jgi:hypothetical protein
MFFMEEGLWVGSDHNEISPNVIIGRRCWDLAVLLVVEVIGFGVTSQVALTASMPIVGFLFFRNR